MAFQLVEILYWLALSTWFGGVLFLAVAWPVITRTLQTRNPVLPDVLSVNIDGQHGNLLTAELIAALQAILSRVEFGCAIGLLVAFIGQLFVIDMGGWQRYLMYVRVAIYIGAVGFLLYQWTSVWPALAKHRNEYVEHADDPEKANVAIELIGHHYRQAVNALTIMFALLLGLILLSASIAPLPVMISVGGGGK